MEVFNKAKLVFPKGLQEEANTLACFRKDFVWDKCGSKAELVIAAHVFYRVWLNGKFAGTGPAPAPFGYLRADRIQITNGLCAGNNKLAIEIMGYVPVENNYATYETSCLCAEVIEYVMEDNQKKYGKVMAATDATWECGTLIQKRTDVETLSFGRRVPMECYELDEAFTNWRIGKIISPMVCEEIQRECRLLERGVELPDWKTDARPICSMVTSLTRKPYDGVVDSWWENEDYIKRSGGKDMKRPSVQCESLADIAFDGIVQKNKCYELKDYTLPVGMEFAFENPETGFIGISFWSKEPVRIDILFNDYLTDEGRVPAKADSVNRVIRLETKGGQYEFEAFECQFVKYVKLIITGGGSFMLKSLSLRSNHFEERQSGDFRCDNELLNRIYQGGKTTLLTNSLGFFLDSPGRERGGWAGDSYWTGRAAQVLLSDNSIERVMLENFLLSESTKMMEYSFPSCCCGGACSEEVMMFTWNLFVLLELTDFYKRTGDKAIKSDFESRVKGWVGSASAFENEVGLLQDIPGSLFLDWSSANKKDYTDPISAPVNALYAMVLNRLGEMYLEEDYTKKSNKIFEILRVRYSKVNNRKYEVFTMYPYMSDSMEFQHGGLVDKDVYSEAAQYYYMWTGLLNKELSGDLAKKIVEELGPIPEKYRGTAHLSIANCGVFFGYLIRFEVLSMLGEYERLRKEMESLCGYMLDQDPGTFWETMSGTDSRNHGFGAHFSLVLVRDFLGIHLPDCCQKTVEITPNPCGLKWAKGGFYTKDGLIQVQWVKTAEEFRLIVNAPKDYLVKITLPNEVVKKRKMLINGNVAAFERRIECFGGITVTT